VEKNIWDNFITNSKNGTFLFYRDYIEYHSDRFIDYSLMFYLGEKLIAVMPSNIKDKTLFSHDGLTFGGIISDERMKASLMINLFRCMKKHLNNIGIERIIYKPIPYIYHKIPAQEDLYALFLNNAKLIRRDISSTVSIKAQKELTKGRKWCIRKSKISGLEIKRSYNFKSFMEIVNSHLEKK
jgi:hypothetical protein